MFLSDILIYLIAFHTSPNQVFRNMFLLLKRLMYIGNNASSFHNIFNIDSRSYPARAWLRSSLYSSIRKASDFWRVCDGKAQILFTSCQINQEDVPLVPPVGEAKCLLLTCTNYLPPPPPFGTVELSTNHLDDCTTTMCLCLSVRFSYCLFVQIALLSFPQRG